MLRFLRPEFIRNTSNTSIAILSALLCLTLSTGLYYALFNSPPDYQQGEMVRVMYIHVPSAWMALGIYTFITACSLSSLVWKTRFAYILALAAAPIGAIFALITLVTGSLWGKPIWGTWWVWDARLTSMLVLFFTYLAYIIVATSGDKILRAEKPAGALALVGFINIPIVKFSVDIWYSLHQPASIIRMQGIAMPSSMLLPLMMMFAAFVLYFVLTLLLRTKHLTIKIKNETRL